MVMSPVMRGLIVISLPILLASGGRIVLREQKVASIPPEVAQAFEALKAPLKIGRVKEAKESLIPSMVPPPGLQYRFKANGWTFHRHWSLHDVSDSAAPFENQLDLFDVKVKQNSLAFGHKSHHVLSKATGEEIFKIRSSRHSQNPFFRRKSFRILPPGSKNNSEALFTVNEEESGRWFQGNEYMIWRGRERDNDPIMYAEGKYPAPFFMGMAAGEGGFKIYADRSKSKLLARIDQNPNYDGSFSYHTEGNRQDLWTITVQPGVDSALILSLSTIFKLCDASSQSR